MFEGVVLCIALCKMREEPDLFGRLVTFWPIRK